MQTLYTRKLNFQFRYLHYTKDSRRRKVIQNNQTKWLLTCNISINSLCFHSQSAVLQGRKVHPQRRLSVSTIKWLNLLKALSSCPFYCCCNHCLEKHTSALHVLVCKSLNSSRKLCEQTCSCLPARWHLDHPALTIPLSLSARSESFPLTSRLFVQAGMAMLYQFALSAARTDFEDLDTTNNCSFHTRYKRTASWSKQNQPSRVHSPRTELLQLCLTPVRTHTPVHTPVHSNPIYLPQHRAKHHISYSQITHFVVWSNLKVSGSTLLTQNKLLLSRNPSNCIEWHPLAIIWYILWGEKKKGGGEINNHNYVLLSGKVKNLTWPEENFISSLPPWPLFLPLVSKLSLHQAAKLFTMSHFCIDRQVYLALAPGISPLLTGKQAASLLVSKTTSLPLP